MSAEHNGPAEFDFEAARSQVLSDDSCHLLQEYTKPHLIDEPTRRSRLSAYLGERMTIVTEQREFGTYTESGILLPVRDEIAVKTKFSATVSPNGGRHQSYRLEFNNSDRAQVSVRGGLLDRRLDPEKSAFEAPGTALLTILETLQEGITDQRKINADTELGQVARQRVKEMLRNEGQALPAAHPETSKRIVAAAELTAPVDDVQAVIRHDPSDRDFLRVRRIVRGESDDTDVVEELTLLQSNRMYLLDIVADGSTRYVVTDTPINGRGESRRPSSKSPVARPQDEHRFFEFLLAHEED